MASRLPSLFLPGCAAILLAAALLRFIGLAEKPIHADESVHAWKVAELLESGDHRYDPAEYHGPTLHYLGAIVAWLAGENSRHELTIGTLRIVPACAGVAVVALTLALFPIIGRGAALGAGAFTAVSPLLVYYSRHFIQEQSVVLFTAASILAGWYAITKGSLRWSVVCGVSFGLLVATKETWVLVAGAAACGLMVVAWKSRGALLNSPSLRRAMLGCAGVFLASACGTSIVFYSAFLTDFHALVDFWHGLVIGAGRSSGGVHDKPWSAYLQLLAWNRSGGRLWSEAPVLIFAACAAPALWPRRGYDGKMAVVVGFLGAFSLALATVYSMLPYKIVWLACGFWHGLAILAGMGAARLFSMCRGNRFRVPIALLVTLALWQLGASAWRAAVTLPAHPRNPYAYVTTSTDINRLAPRIDAIAATLPSGRNLTIKVVLDEYWPLPWILRGFPSTGFWFESPDDWEADVLLVSPETFAQIPADRRDLLATEFFGLRDGVIVILAMDREAWRRSLPDTGP